MDLLVVLRREVHDGVGAAEVAAWARSGAAASAGTPGRRNAANSPERAAARG
uniref:hypothetical protein n=1 Tax=Nonomuraea pusilla TaxID=46177 RepID=UPI00159C5A88|nr:hypothetical protein [Nonomuraea pusilla]